MKLRIIYQDEHYVAVDKPAGLLVHRSPLSAGDSEFALQSLRDQIEQTVYPCHRLDRPTSGVLLFALDRESLRCTQEELANQGCDKVYRAIVRGWTEDSGRIDYGLKTEEAPHKLQSSQTSYRTLARSELPEPAGPYATARFSLVKLNPKTGRKHQLRRHMAHIRHPIIGDTRHGDGAQNRFLREHCGVQRLLLRAETLCFTHGKTRERITVKAGVEAQFQEIAAKLGFEPGSNL
ncbi:MAG TPA: pseudouridine synthase [Opitutales bacterium]|nr:pseudouridine synthase [Opitutales bacterium]